MYFVRLSDQIDLVCGWMITDASLLLLFLTAFWQLRDVRRELQDVLHERDVAVARGARIDDLEETVAELRRHNKELENQASEYRL